MTGILDVCVPSRRRERRRQRQQAKELLHSRFGDLAISAPNEGGWNQLGEGQSAKEWTAKEWTSKEWNAKEWDTKVAQVHGSPDTERTLVDSSPEFDQDFDDVIIVDDSYVPQEETEEKNSITIKIPLPWSAKPLKRSASQSSTATRALPIEATKRDEGDRAPSPPSASPPVIYKPFTATYIQELAKLGVSEDPIRSRSLSHSSPSPPPIDIGRTYNHSSPSPPPVDIGRTYNHSSPSPPPVDIGRTYSHSSPSPPPVDIGRTYNKSPAITILSPVSEDFAKGVNDISPEFTTLTYFQHTASPPMPAIEYVSRQRIPSPPLTLPFDPYQALASHPLERYATPPQAVDGQPTWAEQSCVVPERPGTAMSTRYVVPERPGTAMSTRVVPERPGTAMSTRVVPERPGTAMSTRVVSERPGTAMSTRVVSERPGTAMSTRVVSERPGTAMSTRYDVPERTSTAMSSHSIYIGRSSSRGPSEDRIGTTRARSSSRGPGLDSTSYMRSSSREPTHRRAMSRDPVHRRAASRDAGAGEASRRRASSRGPAPRVRAPSRAASAGPLYRRPIGREDFSTGDDMHISRPYLVDDEDSDSSLVSGGSGATKVKPFEKLKKLVKSPVLSGPDMVPNGEELWA
jgi:hypothetical protein